MNTQAMHAASEPADPVERRARPGKDRRRRRKAASWALAVVAVAGAGAGIWLARPLGGHGGSGGVSDNAYPVSYASVTRRTLTAQASVDGTLSYAGSYSVVNQARGTYTWLPGAGAVIRDGQVLYRVDGSPVILLYGSVPAYRSLAEGQYASSVSGADVGQLNRDLVAMGYASQSAVSSQGWDNFGWETKAGLESLQAALGVTQTGKLDLGQAVFLPSAVRITAVQATLGTQAGPGAAMGTASSTSRQVSVSLSASQQSEVAAGDRVTITLPDGQDTPGRVASVSKVASNSSNGPVVTVLITPLDQTATGTLDQAPVTVLITTASVPDALVVPVSALLSLATGGYAVEEVTPGGTHTLVPVSLGLFDDADGLVQVSGAGLAAGQRVVVPAT